MAGVNFLPASAASSSRCCFKIVEKLEKHDPGQQRQPVEVAVETLVLAHDVARGLYETAQAPEPSFAAHVVVVDSCLTQHRASLCSSVTAARELFRAAEQTG